MITLILIGFLTFLFFVYFKIKYSYWKRKGIKGPSPIPFLGTILAENSLPPKEIEQKFLNEYGPVFGTYFGTRPVLNTSIPHHIKTILSDLKTFPNLSSMEFNDRYLQNSIFFKNGMDWKTGRGVQSHYFTPKKLKNLLVHFDKVTSNFLENLTSNIQKSNSADMDIKKFTKFYAVDVIAKVLFSIEIDSYKEQNSTFVKTATRIGDLNPIQSMLITFLPTFVSKKLGLGLIYTEPVEKLGDYFKKLIQKRKREGAKYDDLISLLQDAVDDKKTNMSEDEMLGNILGVFFAGVETVSNAICHLFYFLSENQHVQTQLYNEIDKEFKDEIEYEKLTQNAYLDAVLSETLRLGAGLLIQNRTAAKNTKLDDIEIEKGTEIRLITYLSHMSPDNFTDPFTFNPDRFLKSSEDTKKNFFAFGSGAKQCLGMRLALVETKYLIVRLLQKYEILKAKNIGIKTTSFRGFILIESINVGFKKRN